MKTMPLRSMTLALCACLTLLAGCQSLPTVGGAGFPADDPADACNAQVQALKADYDYFNEPLISQAMVQGVGALVTSAVLGSSASMDYAMQGFVRDLAAAAISQATQDYLKSIGQETQDLSQVSSRVNSDASGDSQRLAAIRTKIGKLESCRRKQANDIERRFKRKSISAKDARAELQVLQDTIKRDNQLIEQIVGDSGKRVVVYAEADDYVVKSASSKKVKPSSGVKQAKKSQEQVVKEQQKVVELDQIIERKKSGIA